MNTTGDLIGGIKAKQAEISASLAAGNAANWDAYNRLIGHYAGLQEALDILDKLLKEDDDDNDR